MEHPRENELAEAYNALFQKLQDCRNSHTTNIFKPSILELFVSSNVVTLGSSDEKGSTFNSTWSSFKTVLDWISNFKFKLIRDKLEAIKTSHLPATAGASTTDETLDNIQKYLNESRGQIRLTEQRLSDLTAISTRTDTDLQTKREELDKLKENLMNLKQNLEIWTKNKKTKNILKKN